MPYTLHSSICFHAFYAAFSQVPAKPLRDSSCWQAGCFSLFMPFLICHAIIVIGYATYIRLHMALPLCRLLYMLYTFAFCRSSRHFMQHDKEWSARYIADARFLFVMRARSCAMRAPLPACFCRRGERSRRGLRKRCAQRCALRERSARGAMPRRCRFHTTYHYHFSYFDMRLFFLYEA